MFTTISTVGSSYKYWMQANLLPYPPSPLTRLYLDFNNTLSDSSYNISATAFGSPTYNGSLILSKSSKQYLTLPTLTTNKPLTIEFSMKRTSVTGNCETILNMVDAGFNRMSIGIQNNNLYYHIDNSGGTDQLSLNNNTGGTASTTITKLSNTTGGDIAVSYDGRRMVYHGGYVASTGKNLYHSNDGGLNWNTSSGLYLKMVALAITADGSRFVMCQSTGNLFVGTLPASGGIGGLTQITGTNITDKPFSGVGLTADGSRFVASEYTDGIVDIMNWDDATSTYIFSNKKIFETGSVIATMGINADGSILAYCTNATKPAVVKICKWNGTNYNDADYIINGSVNMTTPRNLRFSPDGLVVYASMISNTTSSLWYSVKNSDASHNTFLSTNSTYVVTTKDFLGLSVDGSGNIYMCVQGTTADNITKINPYKTTSSYYINSNLKAITDTNYHTYKLTLDTSINLFVDSVNVKNILNTSSFIPISSSKTTSFVGNNIILKNSYPNIEMNYLYIY